jgi:hypothetical protein
MDNIQNRDRIEKMWSNPSNILRTNLDRLKFLSYCLDKVEFRAKSEYVKDY